MSAKNLFYAQSGGVTAVINATACGVIEAARRHTDTIAGIYAGRDGILGGLHEELIDTGVESAEAIRALRHTPGGAFGSCRYKLADPAQERGEYERLFEVFQAHNIGYFLYNGGGDSQDTALKVARMGTGFGWPVTAIGVPKTVDNDLPVTDCCPGYGSAAKYVAVSVREAALDVAAMARTSTRVFILEVMGRHAGWLAAAGGLCREQEGDPPHLILFPERPFQPQDFISRVDAAVREWDNCVIVASEGLRDAHGELLADAGRKDAFGHAQLGGVAPYLAGLIADKLGYKYHWAVADYLQRSARHIASATDTEQAYALGRAAVTMALEGEGGMMPTIVRNSDEPYSWTIGKVELDKVAGKERMLPDEFLSPDGYGISAACRRYMQPLIEGEDYPPYHDGLPAYVRLKCALLPKRLPPWKMPAGS